MSAYGHAIPLPRKRRRKRRRPSLREMRAIRSLVVYLSAASVEMLCAFEIARLGVAPFAVLPAAFVVVVGRVAIDDARIVWNYIVNGWEDED